MALDLSPPRTSASGTGGPQNSSSRERGRGGEGDSVEGGEENQEEEVVFKEKDPT